MAYPMTIERGPQAGGWVTPDQVAAATDGEVSAETIRRLCRDGRFPRAVKVGRSWVVPHADAVVFLREYDRYKSGDRTFMASPDPVTRDPGAPPTEPQEGS